MATNPAIVDFPEPDEPTKAVTDPAGAEKLMLNYQLMDLRPFHQIRHMML